MELCLLIHLYLLWFVLMKILFSTKVLHHLFYPTSKKEVKVQLYNFAGLLRDIFGVCGPISMILIVTIVYLNVNLYCFQAYEVPERTVPYTAVWTMWENNEELRDGHVSTSTTFIFKLVNHTVVARKTFFFQKCF